MKVTVRIHRKTGLDFKTKKIDDDERITLRKRGKGRAEWRPKVNGLEIKHGWFGRSKYFTDIFPDALETWTVNYPEIVTPALTKEQIIEFGNWEAMRARFRSIKDMGKTSSIMYIILAVQIVSIVITFLLSSGRLRI